VIEVSNLTRAVTFVLIISVTIGCARLEQYTDNGTNPSEKANTEQKVKSKQNNEEQTDTETMEPSKSTENVSVKTAQTLRKEATDIKNVKATQSKQIVSLRIGGEILFDLGQAKIQKEALPILDEIAKLIRQYPNRAVMVQGHTDDLPIQTREYPSNWDLSAQRAVNVVKYIKNLPEIDPSRLIAAGFGKHHPRVPNTSDQNRRKNRRVEFVLYPTQFSEKIVSPTE